MEKLFTESELNRLFEKDGFVIARGVLSENDIAQIEAIAHQYYPSVSAGFHANHRSFDTVTNLNISKQLTEIVGNSLKTFPIQYKSLFSTFAIKSGSSSEQFNLHQDWSVVDETIHNSAQCWISLADSDPSNGGMFVLKGSHKFFSLVRSGSFPISIIPSSKLLQKIITPINLKRGDMLFFKHSLFHGSYANKSLKDRYAVLFSIISANAEVAYFQKSNNASEYSKYSVDGDFFLKNIKTLEKGVMPSGYNVKSVQKYKHYFVNATDLVMQYFLKTISFRR